LAVSGELAFALQDGFSV